MAYRFLLEVPESLAAEAGIAVGEAGDAEVVVVRDSHFIDYDEPYLDLTIAAHSLRVIDNLFQWFDTIGASRPDVRLVLHSGDRLAFESNDASSMVSAIRRDQPWVERSIPKIGEHEVEDLTAADKRQTRSAVEVATTGAAVDTEREVVIRQLNHIALQVADLPRAEAFYISLFSMELIGRAHRTAAGDYELFEGGFAPDAASTGTESIVSFLRNGPLTLALESVGRGARIERSVLSHISVRVDATTFTNLKGQILMRSYEMLDSRLTSFAFRDPFSIAWEITLQGTPQTF
jgi:catechol 2,3-dioxygenase-like lactoylglutathione lyase family enzyme